ncbi:hypothetical protein JW752_04735 [Candidatus Peregrinibacteria bacterium]|nr:hypothetical protein [Candidatus Peregrinibacteria bacterium]
MTKIISVILAVFSLMILTGCGCKDMNEQECKESAECLSVYKPCPEGVFGCLPDGTMFTECRDKEVK